MTDESITLEPSSTSPARIRRRSGLILLALILFALVVRGRAVVSMQDSLYLDPDGYRRISRNLHEHQAFRTPNNSLGPATAYRPPLYPLLLVPSNYWPEPAVFIGWMHVLLGAATVWGVWRLGQLCGLPQWASVVAGVLVAIDPILINQSAQVMTETLAAFLAVWSLVALARLAQTASFGRALMAGAMAGFCVLCRPEFLAWFVCLVAVMPFAIAAAGRRSAGLTIAFVAVAALVVAPWPLRNWKQFGRPILTTTHGGYTLLLANNPGFYEYLRSGTWGSVWNAGEFKYKWSEELLTQWRTIGGVSQRDELGAEARAYNLAFEHIRAEPGMFAYACLVRIGRLWAILPHQLSTNEAPSQRGLRYSVAIWYAAQFTLALVGVWAVGRKLLASPWLWGVLLVLSFTAVHAVYWTNMRMRAPLISVVALATAAGMAWLVHGRRAVTPLPESA